MSFAVPKLKLFKITDNISASLPQDFKVMPDDAIATKYPAPRKPVGAFTNPSGQIDFVVSERSSTFKPEDMQMLKQFYRASITSRYSEVNFIREEVKQINKQEFICFEFTSAMRDEERKTNKLAPIRRYTIVQYTILNDKLLIFTFNAPIDFKPEWQQTALKIMDSIKLS